MCLVKFVIERENDVLVFRLKDEFATIATTNSPRICHFLPQMGCQFYDFWLREFYSPSHDPQKTTFTNNRSRLFLRARCQTNSVKALKQGLQLRKSLNLPYTFLFIN